MYDDLYSALHYSGALLTSAPLKKDRSLVSNNKRQSGHWEQDHFRERGQPLRKRKSA